MREKVLPYQWEALNDRIPGAEKSHCIANLRIAAGLDRGEFKGFIFQDSDLYKWLETVGLSLATAPDPDMEKKADQVIDLLALAQRPDGYLNSYFIVKEPRNRWSNLREAHELYCAGHLFEAAAAYHRATGKRKILDVACRFADLIGKTFGRKPGQIRGYCGHPEIELALIKLHQATGRKSYLDLARYFIEERGRKPSVFIKEARKRGGTRVWQDMKDYDLAYSQAHVPVRRQSEAGGHAVRLVYLYAGAADLARIDSDRGLRKACERIWESVTARKMYVTGGIGSTAHGEAFTGDYDLPSDSMYTETCAAVGLAMWARRMLALDLDSRYGDVMERAVYNSALSGISQDGRRYFYVNPLEVGPESLGKNPALRHVKTVRQAWYACACCPPNIARLIASIGDYAYSTEGKGLQIHLYVGGRLKLRLDGVPVEISLESGFPYAGKVRISLKLSKPAAFPISLRIPDWAGSWSCRVNGVRVAAKKPEKGYLGIGRIWKSGDRVELVFAMPVRVLRSHPRLPQTAGKLALQRGPMIYCLEERDNGGELHDVSVPVRAHWRAEAAPRLPKGTLLLQGRGWRSRKGSWKKTELYAERAARRRAVALKAVPYCLWGNRGKGEMRVWLNEAAR